MSTHYEINDPFAYLEQDHKAVAALLDELDDTTERAEKTREELFAELQEALTLHANLEEQVLYPALEHVKQTHELALEAFEEHHVVKTLLAEMADTPYDTEEWTAKLTVLKENIEHHVEEEETDMFDKARSALTQEQQDALAMEMEKFLQDVV